MWLFFSVLAPLLWAFGNPVDAAIRRNWIRDDFFLTSIFAFTKLPVAIGLLLIFGQGIVLDWSFFWMFFGGMLWMTAFIFFYRSMQMEEVSRVVLILQFQPILILLVAALMLGESITFSQFLAFLLILGGSVLAAIKKSEVKWRFSKAFWLVIIADLIWSLSDVMFKKFAVGFPNFWAAFGVFILGSSLIGAFALLLPRYRLVMKTLKLPFRALGLFFLSAICGTAGSLFFSYALILGNAALTSVITGLQPLFALMFSILLGFFLKEIPRESLGKTDLIIKSVAFVLIISGLIYLYF